MTMPITNNYDIPEDNFQNLYSELRDHVKLDEKAYGEDEVEFNIDRLQSALLEEKNKGDEKSANYNFGAALGAAIANEHPSTDDGVIADYTKEILEEVVTGGDTSDYHKQGEPANEHLQKGAETWHGVLDEVLPEGRPPAGAAELDLSNLQDEYEEETEDLWATV